MLRTTEPGEEKTPQLGREKRVHAGRDGNHLLANPAEVSGSGSVLDNLSLHVHYADPAFVIAAGTLISLDAEVGVKDQKGAPATCDDDENKPEARPHPTQQPSTSTECVLFYTRTGTITYEYRSRPNNPSPDPLGGILAAVNGGLTSVPIDNTARNTELFHFCKIVSPFHLSISLIEAMFSPSVCHSRYVFYRW